MRRFRLILFGFFLGAFLAALPQVMAQEAAPVYRPISGVEWLEMSAGERVDNLLAAMYVLNKSGVELGYTADHYYDAVYQRLQRNPNLYPQMLSDILANCVYEKEPEARAALDRLRNKSA